jgi:hypothetical protein
MIFIVEIIILCFILSASQFPMTRLIKANHSKGWDAKLLAYVPQLRDTVAGLPGGCRSCLLRDGAHGHTRRKAVPMLLSPRLFFCSLPSCAVVLVGARPPPVAGEAA